MRVADMEREAKKRHEEIVKWYNPHIQDFKFKYAGKEYVWKATDLCKFPRDIAEHGEKHLIDLLMHTRGKKFNDNIEREKFRKDIRTKL